MGLINWYKINKFKKDHTLYNVCLIRFNDEFTYDNSKKAIDELLNGLYKKLGLVFGGIFYKDLQKNKDFREFVTHSITKLKLKKDGLYGNITFLKSVPSAKIVINLIINNGFDIFEIMPNLEFTNNIIIKIYTFDIVLK